MSRPSRIWSTETEGRYVGDGHSDAVLLAAGPADPTPHDFDPDTFEPGPAPVKADEADEPAAEEPETDEPAADEADEPAAEEPETDEPAADEADEPEPVEKPARKSRK